MIKKISNSINTLLLGNRQKKMSPFCIAPWSSMSFNMDGTVAVCCYNKKTTVSIVGKSIKEVWESTIFNALREHVEKNDLSYDCQICLNKIQIGSNTNLKARDYDKFKQGKWPQIMEFCLDNVCNLACDMCNSALSSTIRKNNDLPPFQTKYSEEFLNELDEFIPYLKEAVFVGGEPFLIPSYFVIWDKIKKLNPSIIISIVTNGTVLNNRIKSVLKDGKFNLNISIDSVDKNTYEKIRNNAKFDTLMNNFEWFKDYCEHKQTTLNIPICPMTSNWKTIPDVVRFAIKNNAYINFCYVDKPLSLSLIEASPELLETILKSFSIEQFEMNSFLSQQNVEKFKNLILDIEKWRERQLNKLKNNLNFQDWRSNILSKVDVNKKVHLIEILDKIEIAYTSLNKEEKEYVLYTMSQLSIDRIYEACHKKTKKEIDLMIRDVLGTSIKRKKNG